MSDDSFDEIVQSFAKDLVLTVRDRAVVQVDLMLKGQFKASSFQDLHKEFSVLPEECQQFILKIIPICVDDTLAHFFGLIDDNPDYEIYVKGSSSTKVNLFDLGRGLSAECNTWIDKYSKERRSFVDSIRDSSA